MADEISWQIRVRDTDAKRGLALGTFCGCCLRQYRYHYMVPDIDWALVVPRELHQRGLCIECYLRFCEVAGLTEVRFEGDCYPVLF